MDAAQARSGAELAALAEGEPMLLQAWITATRGQRTPEEALALVERGREFHPASPDLLWLQLSLLGQLGRRPEQLSVAEGALRSTPPTAFRAELHMFRVDALLEQGALGVAAEEAVQLQSVAGVAPELIAEAWARVALARQAAGDSAGADLALQHSLAWGPAGVTKLGQLAFLSLTTRQHWEELLGRALERQPGHPDLRLARIVERIQRRDAEGARQQCAALLRPLPERLETEFLSLEARVELLEGRGEEARIKLQARLAKEPGDISALAALFEVHRATGQPSVPELEAHLRQAQQEWRSRPGAAQGALQALAAELQRLR
ncbi:MAG: hypothetical protein ACT4PU_02235 [Planctomycetota bacterium]